jgi:pimeloyl-ACP methyl ester carboxylesterase
LVLVLAVVITSGWIMYRVSRPPHQAYYVTPQTFAQISGPVLQATDGTWTNRDGTNARGWLLRGEEGAPAVVFLHRYGGDRSWVFNVGVKLHETAGFTILWVDLRGHGMDPPVKWTAFGTREGDDVLAALDYLKALKADRGQALVGDHIGIYGVELGAYAALKAAPHDTRVRVLVLDSAPTGPDGLLRGAVRAYLGVDNRPIQFLVRGAARVYFLGRYDNTSACDLAHTLPNQHVLLLSGDDAGDLRESTAALARCFPNQTNVEVKTDLPLTGYKQPSATGKDGEEYDRRVIDFFDKNLRVDKNLSPHP